MSTFSCKTKTLALLSLGVLAISAGAFPQSSGSMAMGSNVAMGPQDSSMRQECPFNDTMGPNVLVAQVTIPNGNGGKGGTPTTTEYDGWIFGYNWCSNSVELANNPDICSGRPDGKPAQYLHMPLTDKYGAIDWNCYANVEVTFSGCGQNQDGSVDYSAVQATFVGTDTGEQFTYPCKQDTEHRGCQYNGQNDPPLQTDFEAFLACGILAAE